MNERDEKLKCTNDAVVESIEHISHGAGTSRFGNFHNYYEFNPPTKRLSLLSSDWASILREEKTVVSVFDVGCNSGELTHELHCQLKSLNFSPKTLGFDIDPVLVAKAEENFGESSLRFQTIDVTTEGGKDLIDEFAEHYDIGFCFAVTMWIHLNHGDVGLRQFLRYTCSKCDFLIIEPQTWKCYRNASRRMRKMKKELFQHIDNLTWKNDVVQRIDEFIQDDCDMELVKHFGITPWGRPLTMYRRKTKIKI